MKKIPLSNQSNLQLVKEAENNYLKINKVSLKQCIKLLGKNQRDNDAKSKHGSNIKHGRWSKEEHFRFLEALKLFGKEWRKV